MEKRVSTLFVFVFVFFFVFFCQTIWAGSFQTHSQACPQISSVTLWGCKFTVENVEQIFSFEDKLICHYTLIDCDLASEYLVGDELKPIIYDLLDLLSDWEIGWIKLNQYVFADHRSIIIDIGIAKDINK